MRWRRLNSWIFRNGALKLFSLAFAFGLWLLVNAGERDTEQTMLVPVELRNISQQFVVVGQRPEFVDVRVSGPRTLLGRLSGKKIALDLTGVRPGPSSFRVSAELLSLPRGVKLLRVTPSVIGLDIARMIKRVVPVRVDLVGSPPFGYEIGEIEVAPSTVEVSGPAPQVERLAVVMTEVMDISRLTQSATKNLGLQGLDGEFVSYNIELARVHVDIQEVIATREFRRLRVSVKNAAFRLPQTPFFADVWIRGPQRIVDRIRLTDGDVFVDAGGQGPGEVTLPVTVLAPPGVAVISQYPTEVDLNFIAEDEKKSPKPPIVKKRKKSGA
ncbi:MAG: YbbR-like domain-containing protein [Candidatus Binatia bacterium]